MQKALEQMNVKLTEVVSDITGADGPCASSGRSWRANATRSALAALRDPKCKNERRADRPGPGRDCGGPNTSSPCGRRYELYQFHHRQIDECDQQIEAELAKLPNRAGDRTLHGQATRAAGVRPTTSRFDATGPLFQALGVDLTEIEGIDVGTALVILAEIGVDVSRFPTEKHFASVGWGCARTRRESNQTQEEALRRGRGREPVEASVADGGPGGGTDARSPLGLFYPMFGVAQT